MNASVGQFSRVLSIVKQREELAERKLLQSQARLLSCQQKRLDYIAQLDHPMSFVIVAGRVIAKRILELENEIRRAQKDCELWKAKLLALRSRSSLIEDRISEASATERLAASEAELEELSDLVAAHKFQAS